MKYVGHVISQLGRARDGQRKKANLEAPKPVTKCNMMQFLGMTHFLQIAECNCNFSVTKKGLYDKPLTTSFVINKLSQRFCADGGLLRSIRDMSAAARVRTKAETEPRLQAVVSCSLICLNCLVQTTNSQCSTCCLGTIAT